jgi:lysozyme family protein
MADFLKAHKKTAFNEGGYANDPKDRGGETWKGIARNFWPNWEGWAIVDSYKKKNGFPGNLKNAPGLEDMVLKFYRKNFWNPIRGDEIEKQDVADPIYDMAVNSGVPTAIRLAQDAAFGKNKSGVTNGKMDEGTLNKLNNEI